MSQTGKLWAMVEPFLIGVNDYYDSRLPDVSQEAVGDRLKGIADLGAKAVRLLLPWSELQPEENRVPDSALRWLESYLEKAKASGLHVVPVFFCGRLSESNWLPGWMCETPHRNPKPLDFYRERYLIRAQQLQIDVVVGAFADHAAVLGWDLGRETSALVPAPDPDAARSRQLWLLEALKKRDETHGVTLTLSQMDLEEDRGMRPAGLGDDLDFLSIRVAPGDTSRAIHGIDASGFYCALVRALSGKPVLISELEVPEEGEGGKQFEELLESARQSGAMGALAWSHEDVVRTLVAESSNRFNVSNRERIDAPSRIHVEEESYFANPGEGIRVAYEEFQADLDSDKDKDKDLRFF